MAETIKGLTIKNVVGGSQEIDESVWLVKHAAEFTKIENIAIVYVLRGWFAALQGVPGAIEAGDDAWSLSTLHEHFNSELNARPETRTATNIKVNEILKQKAKQAQDKLLERTGGELDEDERMNEELDKYVEKLLVEIKGGLGRFGTGGQV